MHCKEVQTLLIDYLDQTLDAASAGRVKQHLEECQECRREAHELQMLLAAMKDTVAETPPVALRESFNTMLQSELNMLTTANIIEEFPGLKKDREDPSPRVVFSCVEGRSGGDPAGGRNSHRQDLPIQNGAGGHRRDRLAAKRGERDEGSSHAQPD